MLFSLDLAYTLTYALLIATITGLALFGTARWMDKSMGISFKKDVWPLFKEHPQAAATYFGLRIVGLGILWHSIPRLFF